MANNISIIKCIYISELQMYNSIHFDYFVVIIYYWPSEIPH